MFNFQVTQLKVNEIVFIIAGMMTILGVFLYKDWGGYAWLMTKIVYFLGILFLIFEK